MTELLGGVLMSKSSWKRLLDELFYSDDRPGSEWMKVSTKFDNPVNAKSGRPVTTLNIRSTKLGANYSPNYAYA